MMLVIGCPCVETWGEELEGTPTFACRLGIIHNKSLNIYLMKEGLLSWDEGRN